MRQWLLSSVFLAWVGASLQQDETINVTLPDGGVILGKRMEVQRRPLDVYLGVPYTKRPTGDRRFRNPEPFETTPRLTEAFAFRPACYQTHFNPQDHANGTMDEDCLYLNIWAPSGQTDLTTMVYLHGGQFISGSSDEFGNNPQNLAATTNVIVVSLNYRLSSFGFVDHGYGDSPGNMGLYDQHNAFMWIHMFVGFFGGDPGKVTLYGQNAGAFSIGYHLSFPANEGLFNRVILQSGVPNSLKFQLNRDNKTKAIEKYFEVLNCPRDVDPELILECLQAHPTEDILEAEKAAQELDLFAFTPNFNGHYIPYTSLLNFNPSFLLPSDVLLGVTVDQGSLTAQYVLSQVLAQSGEVTLSALTQYLYDSIGVPDRDLMEGILQLFFQGIAEDDVESLYEALVLFETYLLYKCPIIYFSNILAARDHRVYLYYFAYLSQYQEGSLDGVADGTDVQYALGLPQSSVIPYTEKEEEFSVQMMEIFASFAKTGHPSSYRHYCWDPYVPPQSEGPDTILSMPLELHANYSRYFQPEFNYCAAGFEQIYYPD